MRVLAVIINQISCLAVLSDDQNREKCYRQKSFFGDDEFLIRRSKGMDKKENSQPNQTQEEPTDSNGSSDKGSFKTKVLIDIKEPRKLYFEEPQKGGLLEKLDRNILVLIGSVLGVIVSAICVEYVHKNSFLQAVFIGLTAIFFGVLVALAVKLVRDVKIGINKSDKEE